MKLFKKQVKVHIGFRVVFGGLKFRKLRKDDLSLPKEQYIDHNNYDELGYLMNVMITEPGVKVYMVYHDGTQKRIKIHRTFSKVNIDNL